MICIRQKESITQEGLYALVKFFLKITATNKNHVALPLTGCGIYSNEQFPTLLNNIG